MEKPKEDKLKVLYQTLADMTLVECREVCRNPFSCCDSLYCEITIEFAKEKYGIELSRTDHPDLPLMGPSGCIAEPYLRPMCAAHTCEISSLGFKKSDLDWTEKYFELRDSITVLEWELDDENSNSSD